MAKQLIKRHLRRTVLRTKLSFFMIVCSLRKLPYIFDQNRQEIERLNEDDSFLKLNKYAHFRRSLHERKYGLYESDYGAMKIDWDKFVEVFNKRRENYVPKYKHKSLVSTFDPKTNQRIYY